MRVQLIWMACACVALAGCAAEPEPVPSETPPAETTGPAAGLPATIVAERGGFIPEGIEYDTENDRILTGSLAEGSVFQIHPDGRVTAVVTDPDLVSSVGIEVDEPRDRLLVANADRAVFEGGGSGQAQLGVYNLSTGERIAMVDLSTAIDDPGADAAYFANDVTVDENGTIYVTDTRMGVVYRVDSDYQPSLLHRFEGEPPPALNGIVHHPSGYLLIAAGSTLFRMPTDNPAAVSEVEMPETIAGMDGIVWTDDGRLAIVSNSESRVVALRSDDDWKTAQLAGVASYDGQATTAAAVGDEIYVVKPHFADQDPPTIERATFQ